mgnify:CR=1 FL=1
MSSQVEHPSHYNEIPNWEVIDTIEKDLSPEEYIGFLKGNILKYRLRAGYKGDVQQDIDKANYYKDILLKFLSKQTININLDTMWDRSTRTGWPVDPFGINTKAK